MAVSGRAFWASKKKKKQRKLGLETFLVFTQTIPSQNLGFIDSKSTILNLTVAGRDLNIAQSPGLLSSDRNQGTTGAVVWKITPLFADWICGHANILARCGVLPSGTSHVLELGSGISGIISLVLAPRVKMYLATDQEYLLKYLRQNITDNTNSQPTSKSRKKKAESKAHTPSSNIIVRALDWETDDVHDLYHEIGFQGTESIDLIISCDCIYNEALVEPFVNICKDICRLAPTSKPTVCVVAQMLRSPEVFEAWLIAFHKHFHVWQVPDEFLDDGLKEGTGFILHIGILRQS
ncbi:hypothetical protein E6O75_ATG05265 [Venturia nashicola]|uniref:Diaminohydroxyphosphoribosylamino-pyrimidine deaminase n=1 Tax=Venturia nashicola TaxID=86259 RepID=A0A4Z1P7K1_9PEZI|nr:hypothetical protein E6O75_ATG05265 [Venturia nashicola]